ncbi:unnamed protein product [Thlaspi arvense]|uniref:PWWP domain-containing protein n=1 Tax=Thlaspi arvense TaxID=13288 RepID=A0AAU9S4W5_THLAR|nr:unnamed protein product [Thlaspi arvense]
MKLDSVATDTGSDGDDNKNGDGDGSRVTNSTESKELWHGKFIGSEGDWDIETEPRFSEMKRENSSQVKDEDAGDQFYEVCDEDDEKKLGMASKEEKRVPDYNTLLSEFDDYVASEGVSSGASRALSHGFEVGDMVWGKVKSHPWWPGHVFSEAFVSPSVRRMRKMGHVLVAFYGDCSYGWFDPAELIPFEPHFAEKTQQTVSSNFAKAVEEAMDEAGKRSALGLACKCRNPFNFRPSNVQGYFAVTVPGYELQVVYSSKQIKKARDSFSCAQTLSFVRRCALAPQDCDSDCLKFYQKKAAVCAFRRAVFEEFDETYEEAFRAKSAYTSATTQEPIKRATPRGSTAFQRSWHCLNLFLIFLLPPYHRNAVDILENPGPFRVVNEVPLSGPLVTAETLGDPKTSRNAIKVQATSQLQGINGSSTGKHVLQRRTPYLKAPMKHEQTGLVSVDFISPSGDIPGKFSVSKLSRDDDKCLAQEPKSVRMGEKAALFSEHEKFETMASVKQVETGTHPRSNEGLLEPFIERKCAAGDGIKKVNVLKRSSGEMDSENATKMKKKKESRSEQTRYSADKRKTLSSEEARANKSSQLDSTGRHFNMLTGRSSKLDVLQMLSNLQALSLEPFHGSSNISSIRAVRQFFLRFLSLNYHKSLDISPPTTKPSKSAKALRSTNEPSKAGRKRLSSDQQQDVPSTKKLKKTNRFKTLPSDKKTNQEEKKRSNFAPLNPVRHESGPVPINAKAQAGKKTKEIVPTMLVMKFPHGASLPSTALLKARFSRFGLLDQSAIRTALRYASGSNSLFGNVNVTYFLRDVKVSSASEGHEPKKAKTDEPLNQRLERAQPVHQPSIHLKSCLKEPGNNGNGNRGKARVRFMLGGKETGTPFLVSGRDNRNCASSSVAMEYVPNTQNMVPSALPWLNSKAKL